MNEKSDQLMSFDVETGKMLAGLAGITLQAQNYNLLEF